MSKTIEDKLKDLELKENRLKNQQKELKQLRKELENQKQVEDVKQKNLQPYVKKFKDLCLNFEYKLNKIEIKPLDFKKYPILSFIYIKESETTTKTLDNLLENIRLGHEIEKNTDFKIYDANILEFQTEDSEGRYFLNIRQVGNEYQLDITKENYDDEDNYRKEINKNLTIIVESSGYDGFTVKWEYNSKATKDNLIQKIKDGVVALNKY